MLTASPIRIGSARVPEQVLDEAVSPALDRKPAELVGEEILEDDDVDEDRDRQAHRADDHHHAVGQRSAHVRDRERQADRDQRVEDEQRNQHGQRGTEARRQDVRYLLVGAPARAEVGGEDLLDEDPELHVVRLVDAELAADVVDLLLVADLAGQDVRRVAADGVEKHEHQQHDPQHRRDHLPDASSNVTGHRARPSPRRIARGTDSGCKERPGDPRPGASQYHSPEGALASSLVKRRRRAGSGGGEALPAAARAARLSSGLLGTTRRNAPALPLLHLLLLFLGRRSDPHYLVLSATSMYAHSLCRIGCFLKPSTRGCTSMLR